MKEHEYNPQVPHGMPLDAYMTALKYGIATAWTEYLEQFENATKAAKRAIDASETYGYELLAKIAMCSSDEYNSFSDIENHESLIQKVTQESRRAYLGVNLEGVKILEGIGKEQLQKLDNIFS